MSIYGSKMERVYHMPFCVAIHSGLVTLYDARSLGSGEGIKEINHQFNPRPDFRVNGKYLVIVENLESTLGGKRIWNIDLTTGELEEVVQNGSAGKNQGNINGNGYAV